MVIWIIVALVFVVGGYIRLAPSDPARWHVEPEVTENREMPNGVLRIATTGPDGLERFNEVALQTPRTSVVSGWVRTEQVTYVTRSKIWGFPDYTTVKQDGDQLKIYARARFGRSDFGVNAARVDGWLKAIEAR
ncbi:DUF1499 domain-containing protein [Phaeobacter marinintestinus]|uniref:DUF1499 domain-containing protein n=1 Tax=Falsiphaeobacter marinintestinus TaxID=1492905 RepID=UPI001FE6F429|nr:DUF1499 domain-containing protein [Phaeobacter marinintestinus]